jgi:DNA-binding transcriptional regulator YhcF (GntR family)
VRGTGMAVADSARRRCQTERLKMVRERIRQVFLEAQQSCLEPDQLRTLVESELAAIQRKEQ